MEKNIWDKTIEVIERRGWEKGDLGTTSRFDPVCLVGALTVAAYGDDQAFHHNPPAEPYRQLRRAIGQKPEVWNDVPWRTERGVLKLLKRLSAEEIKRAQLEGQERERNQRLELERLEAQVRELRAKLEGRQAIQVKSFTPPLPSQNGNGNGNGHGLSLDRIKSLIRR